MINFLILLLLLLKYTAVTLGCLDVEQHDSPPHEEVEKVIRWTLHNAHVGVLSTTSSVYKSSDSSSTPFPFGNIVSFAEGFDHQSTGVLYFQKSMLDISMKDLSHNPSCSLTVSAESIGPGYCTKYKQWDPQDPRCTRLVVSGQIIPVNNATELNLAKRNLYNVHPSLRQWNNENQNSHQWLVLKFVPQQFWVIDFFGGGKVRSPSQIYDVKTCDFAKKPLNLDNSTALLQSSSTWSKSLYVLAVASVALVLAGIFILQKSRQKFIIPSSSSSYGSSTTTTF